MFKMDTKIIFTFLFLLIGNIVWAKHIHPEKYYQIIWCNQHGGIMEFVLLDQTRVDCETPTYSVEVGFADHKYEDVSQSLYYASRTGKKPGIVTISENGNHDFKNLQIERYLCHKFGIKLWIVNASYK